MPIPTKGVRDIRTHAGKARTTNEPHTVYMQITCLEMEKARRGKERASAIRRVENINARFQEIEAEKELLLRAVGACASGAQGNGDPAGRRVFRQTKGGYTFRY